jgi:sugar lactone lactonase YvrE
MKQGIFLLIVSLLINHNIKAQTIITVAGSTAGTYVGDGGPATNSNLGTPIGLAIDASGNLYIADYGADRVRKVNSAGIITTVAGNGLGIESGDNGPATNAAVGGSDGVAFDAVGNLYISAVDSNRIRKVDTAGIITTIAGYGRVYGGDGGPATAAGIGIPSDVVVDGRGNIYFSEQNKSKIRKIDPTGTISTFAGTGLAGYNGDNIPATAAQLNYLKGLAIDDTGNVYVGDYLNYRVRKIDTFGMITTIAGTGTLSHAGDGGAATAASLSYPAGVATDHAGNIYISDGLWIRKVDTAGIISTISGGGTSADFGDGGPATAGSFEQTAGIKVGADGSIYIADGTALRVRKIVPSVPSESLSSGTLTKRGEGLSVAPNPTSGAITVQAPKAGSFVVYNMVGQQVAAYKVANCATDVRLPAALAAGVYMGVYKADDGGAQQMVRLVVVR